VTRGPQVLGFDYATKAQVSMTPAEWRAKYPRATHRRDARTIHTGGESRPETWYWHGRELAAEAYAIIPAGK
jgi:hypothetical protein